MPARSERRSPPRGYALITVVVITVLILTGAAILIVASRESEIAGIKEKRETEAYGVAMAGLQWMLTNMNSAIGKDQLVEAAELSDTATPPQFVAHASGVRIHHFYPDDKYGGVVSAPPTTIGTNSADGAWIATGNGHYALFAEKDPVDPKRSVIIRAIGVVRDVQVMLEGNLALNVAQSVPAGIVGCFDPTLNVTFRDRQGPYDYLGSTRYDGTVGVPFAMAVDADRVNGLAKDFTGSAPAPVAGYPTGRRFRGTQALRTPGDLALDTQTIFGGDIGPGLHWFDDNAGPNSGWAKNPWMANDPRLVDAPTLDHRGLGMNGGFVFKGDGATPAIVSPQRRGLPLVSFNSSPNYALGGTEEARALLGQNEWRGQSDPNSDSGFYGCSNVAATTNNAAVESCVKGTQGNVAPDWTANSVNDSGRAWNIVASVMRHCTGSGSSIDPTTGSPWHDALNNPNGVRCENGWEWLENVAACLVVPRNVAANNGTRAERDAFEDPDLGGTTFSGKRNNFAGCHPGCLYASDELDSDTTIYDDLEDTPFRSVCINLDAENVTTYGPGAVTGFGAVGSALDETSPPPSPLNPYGAGWRAYVQGPSGPGAANATLPPASPTDTPRFKTAPVGTFNAVPPTIRAGGFVSEPGNAHLITRLDLSDRGPLGTCEQNCIAYGWGKDRTYGAHRTDLTASPGVAGSSTDRNCSAKVPTEGSTLSFATEPCNYDYDSDGFFDRRSMALISSYREECADPHSGLAWGPAVNISSSNDAIQAGCRNRLPNWDDDQTGLRMIPFCENGNDADLLEAVAQLESVATIVSTSAFNNTGGTLNDGNGWWGQARCHMGSTSFSPAPTPAVHPHTGAIAGLPAADTDRFGRPDYWMEDECKKPVVIRLGTNANINMGKVCGCGILIFEENSLDFNGDAHFLWRGLVIWNFKSSGGTKDIQIRANGNTTFYVEGSMLMTGSGALRWIVDKELAGGAGAATSIGLSGTQKSAKMHFRLNEKALEDAFAAFKMPARAIRRIR